MRWLYRHVEEWTNHKVNIKSITRRIPNSKRQPIFSRGSRACQHATSPLCQPTLDGLAAKRCCTNLVHTIGHRKNLPTSEVTQWHEQSTRVTFRRSAGEGTRPLTITGRWPRTITNSCQSSSVAPSRLGGGNHQEQQVNPVAKHKHQVPLDAITQAMHLDSLLISQKWWINDGDEWVKGPNG